MAKEKKLNCRTIGKRVSEKTKLLDITRSSEFVRAVFEEITNAIMGGEKVHITGFGTFEVATWNAREKYNPRTGEKMMCDSRPIPKFKAAQSLRTRVSGKDE